MILIELYKIDKYRKVAYQNLIGQLIKSAKNQLPMYAERALPIIKNEHKKEFIEILKLRVEDVEKNTKRKRIEKVISKLEK